MNYTNIGSFIAKRKELNMTQKELAEKLGVTDKAVSKWERGLGCPDVSILEILSSTLHVSILEILKGRIIENEIISVTEANDYIKDTLIYSNEEINNKYKKIIINILTLIIIGICSFLVIININHIFYLNQTYEYYFDESILNRIEDIKQKIEDNILVIKENNFIYEQNDYNQIIDILDSYINKIEEISLFKYEGKKKFTLSDLYQIDSEIISLFSLTSGYNILEKYDSSITDYKDLLKDSYVSRIWISQNFYNEYVFSYQYKFSNIYVHEGSYNEKIQPRLIDNIYRLKEIYYFTDHVIEVGELYE